MVVGLVFLGEFSGARLARSSEVAPLVARRSASAALVLELAQLPEIGSLVASRLGVPRPRIRQKNVPKRTVTNSLKATVDHPHAKDLDCA